jgi:hypothetical protein
VKPAPDAQDPLARLDHLVGAAPEPENAVLTDDARLVRWAGRLFLLFHCATPFLNGFPRPGA